MLYSGKRRLQVFLSAGEASGDLHGAELVRAIRAIEPDARITCLGGGRLRQAGAEVLVDNRDIAVVGLFEVVRHLPVIHAAWKTIRNHLLTSRPDAIVLIDFPDFNFLLARLARRLGIKVLYYITPQVWAWRSGRVRTLKRYVDRMAVILPFEAAFYAKHGMKVEYVGHPLLDVLAGAPSVEEAREKYRPKEAGWVVGLLPGSRHSEIRSLLPLMLDSAQLIFERLPGAHFVLPVAPSIDRETIVREVLRRNLPIRIISGDAYGVMRACDLLITASGTVTLEAAILGAPMVITYRVSDLSYYAGRRLIKVDCVGLPNLIAGRKVVPELLQRDARPELLARAALSYLESPARLAEAKRDLVGIRDALGSPGVAERVAQMVLETAAVPGASMGPSAPPCVRSGEREPVLVPMTSTFKGPSRELPEGIRDHAPPRRALPWSFYAQALVSIPLYPFLVLYYATQSVLKGKYRLSGRMRLGLELPDPCRADTGSRLWIHALSVGESHSVAPLVKALRAIRPDVEILFSTATETGQGSARGQLSDLVDRFFYMPHDLPWVMERLIRRVKPSAFVLVETDTWPGLLTLLKHHSTPAILVNGRISPRSFRRMLPLRPVVAHVLNGFDQLLAQSEDDRRRYVALGAAPHRVKAMGNLKFDAALSPSSEAEVRGLREEMGLGGERLVWAAGSTHEGEESALLQVHEALRATHKGLLLILAPRDIRRAGEIGEIARRMGMKVGYRSRRDRTAGVDVYLLDTFGELRRAYGLADMAFIGGSLVPFGGHNPLEAVAQGKPVCWGPHLFNFREIEAGLLEAGCGTRVVSLPELQGILLKWLEDEDCRERVRRVSGGLMQKHAGTAERIARLVSQMLVERSDRRERLDRLASEVDEVSA